MDVEAVSSTIGQQLGVVASAPVPFVVALVVAFGLIWRIVQREFATKLSNAQSTIELLNVQLADYKQKLSGASPDEAKARIEALEAEVAKVRPRMLTEDQKKAIASALEGTKGLLAIHADARSWDALRYSDDFARTFEAVGWKASQHVIGPQSSIDGRDRGLILRSGAGDAAARVRVALSAGALEFYETKSEPTADVCWLFIFLAE